MTRARQSRSRAMSFSAFDRIYGEVTHASDVSLLDFDEVQDKPVNHVWSATEGDNGEIYLSPGFHIVNLLGYVVTERPWTEEDLIDLVVKW